MPIGGKTGCFSDPGLPEPGLPDPGRPEPNLADPGFEPASDPNNTFVFGERGALGTDSDPLLLSEADISSSGSIVSVGRPPLSMEPLGLPSGVTLSSPMSRASDRLENDDPDLLFVWLESGEDGGRSSMLPTGAE